MASVLAGLAVLAILQCLESTVATQTVLLAAADIDRGQTIRAGDVKPVSVPASDAFAGTLRHVADAEGLIAQVDIAEGMPIRWPANVRRRRRGTRLSTCGCPEDGRGCCRAMPWG